MIKKNFNNISKKNFFFLFLFSIFFFRSFHLYFSLSYFPWFYEWQTIPLLIDIKNNDYWFLFEQGMRNQYQIFTKISYIFFLKVASNVWYPKIATIFIQIIPALSISLIVTKLFYNKIKIKSLSFAILILFSLVPGSLANFYHFSESHFYFQILLSILSFYIFDKYYCSKTKLFLFQFIIFISLSFNMAAVTITIFLTYLLFFLFKFFFEKNKKNLINFLIILFLLFIYKFFCSYLNVSSIQELNMNNISLRSLYLFFKAMLHQNNLLFGLLFFCTIYSYFCYNLKLKELLKNNFLILLIIFSLVLFLSMSAGKPQIYDRYKDFLSISGLISIFLLIYNDKNKIIFNFLKFILFLIVIYNLAHFERKVIIRQIDSKNYDASILSEINNYKKFKIPINKNNLEHSAKRFPVAITMSVDKKILNFQIQ